MNDFSPIIRCVFFYIFGSENFHFPLYWVTDPSCNIAIDSKTLCISLPAQYIDYIYKNNMIKLRRIQFYTRCSYIMGHDPLKLLIEKEKNSMSQKVVLYNLDHWLGLVTLANEKEMPIDQEKLLRESSNHKYYRNQFIIPFVTTVDCSVVGVFKIVVESNQ